MNCRWISIKLSHKYMLMLILSLLSAFWLLPLSHASSPVEPLIEELLSFKNVSVTSINADRNTLVIFDVDDVLLVQDDLILRSNPETMAYFKFLFNKFGQKFGISTSEQWNYLKSKIHLFSQRHVIEPDVVELIKEMQAQGIKVIALTACSVGQCGSIESLPDWRVQDLDNHRMNFGQAFPKINDISFNSLSNNTDKHPVFKSGCLFSAEYSKGSVLKYFINHYLKTKYPEWQAKKIVFFDDQRPNLESVGTCVSELGFEYKGFHYKHPEAQQPLPQSPLCLEKIENQIRYLFRDRNWFSDHHPALIPIAHQ